MKPKGKPEIISVSKTNEEMAQLLCELDDWFDERECNLCDKYYVAKTIIRIIEKFMEVHGGIVEIEKDATKTEKE